MSFNSYEKRLATAIKNGQIVPESNYDIWVGLGNEGTPEDFINFLRGDAGTHAVVVNNTTITADSWVLENGIYKATITNENILSTNVINVNFTSDSLSNAINSGVLGYTNSIDGGFEIFANFKPEVDLVIDYAIISY